MARHGLQKPPRDEAEIAEAQREFLDRELCMKAVNKLEVMFATGDGEFPAAVDTMWAMLNDDSVDTVRKYNRDGELTYESEKARVSPDLKVKIIKSMTDLIALKDRAAQEAGVGKGPAVVIDNRTVNATGLSALTLEEVQALPESVQRKLEGELIGVVDAEVQ